MGTIATSQSAARLPAHRTLRYLRRVIYWLGVALTAAALAAVLVTMGARVLGYQPYVMYGGSMGSTVPVGSIALIENVPATSLKVGDVVVFEPPSSEAPHKAVMHRIISTDEVDGQRVFGTKGDANESPDPWNLTISGEGGRLAYVVPYVGYLLWFFHTRLAWAVVVLPMAGYLGLLALRRIWAPARSRDAPSAQAP